MGCCYFSKAFLTSMQIISSLSLPHMHTSRYYREIRDAGYCVTNSTVYDSIYTVCCETPGKSQRLKGRWWKPQLRASSEGDALRHHCMWKHHVPVMNRATWAWSALENRCQLAQWTKHTDGFTIILDKAYLSFFFVSGYISCRKKWPIRVVDRHYTLIGFQINSFISVISPCVWDSVLLMLRALPKPADWKSE